MSATTVDTTTIRHAPPGPKGLPLLGITTQVRKDPLGYFARAAAEYEGLWSALTRCTYSTARPR